MNGKEILYNAFKSKDARLDGKFFVGVSSTGIYCRPVCHAKMPKFENCTFFKTAAEAEKAGYRPCLVCRPELAPRNGSDSRANLVARVAVYIEENCSSGMSVPEIGKASAIQSDSSEEYFLRSLMYHLLNIFRHADCCLPKNLSQKQSLR